MLARDRVNMIMEILQQNGSALVSELSAQFGVTEETIRRDLSTLEKENKLRRVHGGAYISKEFEKEIPVNLRRQLCTNEKNAIASACLDFISDGDTIFLDRSTTACQIARLLKEKNYRVTVVTNSFEICTELASSETVRLISLGGTYHVSTSSFSGNITHESISKIYAAKSFISCSGMQLDFGMGDNFETEAQIRLDMLKNSRERYLIVDHYKIGKIASFFIADYSQIDVVITDYEINDEWRALFSSKNIRVYIAFPNT